ncbi:MAG TPA: TetR/AcrR family transcriptional regulator [Caulobacteraceae bacterium]
MPRSALQKAQTRRKILDETVRALRRGGVHAVRIHQVMRQAGLTHGGFYAHFASREALLAEAASEMSGASDALMRLQRHPGPPAAALAGFLDHYLSLAHCERAHGACALPILLPDADELPPDGRASALRLAAHLTEALARRFEALGQAAPQDLARRLLAEVIGLITLARAQPTRAGRARLLARAREDLGRAYGVLPVGLSAASLPEPEARAG